MYQEVASLRAENQGFRKALADAGLGEKVCG